VVLSFIIWPLLAILIGEILNEIKREIIIIHNRLGVIVRVAKVKAHQDEVKLWSQLSFLEKVNNICNKQAKRLIVKVPTKYLIEYYISIQTIRPYFTKWYRYDSELVDWESWAKLFKLIRCYIYCWVSKSLANFASTAHRMKHMGLWNDDLCRCCLKLAERDTFYMMEYNYRILSKLRMEIYNKLANQFSKMDRNEQAL